MHVRTYVRTYYASCEDRKPSTQRLWACTTWKNQGPACSWEEINSNPKLVTYTREKRHFASFQSHTHHTKELRYSCPLKTLFVFALHIHSDFGNEKKTRKCIFLKHSSDRVTNLERQKLWLTTFIFHSGISFLLHPPQLLWLNLSLLSHHWLEWVHLHVVICWKRGSPPSHPIFFVHTCVGVAFEPHQTRPHNREQFCKQVILVNNFSYIFILLSLSTHVGE